MIFKMIEMTQKLLALYGLEQFSTFEGLVRFVDLGESKIDQEPPQEWTELELQASHCNSARFWEAANVPLHRPVMAKVRLIQWLHMLLTVSSCRQSKGTVASGSGLHQQLKDIAARYPAPCLDLSLKYLKSCLTVNF